ncbi:unnamed protein product [Diplocarpon coronariae]|nr:hypothetical protein JHW43_005306 [Diplocarpon mali]
MATRLYPPKTTMAREDHMERHLLLLSPETPASYRIPILSWLSADTDVSLYTIHSFTPRQCAPKGKAPVPLSPQGETLLCPRMLLSIAPTGEVAPHQEARAGDERVGNLGNTSAACLFTRTLPLNERVSSKHVSGPLSVDYGVCHNSRQQADCSRTSLRRAAIKVHVSTRSR